MLSHTNRPFWSGLLLGALLLAALLLLLLPRSASAATCAVPGPYATIQAAINDLACDTIEVAPGNYSGNITVNRALTLRSTGGAGVTTLTGVSNGSSGTIRVTSNTNGFVLGGPGQGFTIIGIDNPSPGLESAAVYFQGSHSNAQIRNNVISANGDAGLITEFGAIISGFVIDGNTFDGQTFTGANPAGDGFSQQFTLANVPRQCVVMGGGSGGGNTSNITFSNNSVTCAAGGLNPSNQPQGNNLVTIDSNGATITGNSFNGTTARFATSLRVRGPNTSVSGNTFLSGNLLLPATGHIFVQNSGQTLGQVAAANTFDRGVYVDGTVGTLGLVLPASIPANTAVYVLAGSYSGPASISMAGGSSLIGPNAGINACSGARGAEATASGAAIVVGGSNVTINGMAFSGGTGATISQQAGVSTADVAVLNNLFSAIGRWAVYHTYSPGFAGSNWTVNANNVDGWTGNDGTGLLLWNVNGAEIAHNCVRNLVGGVTGSRGIGVDTVTNANVHHNTVSDLDRWAFQVADSFAVQSGAVLAENTISDVQVGIQLVALGAGNGLQNTTVQSNTISSVDAIAIYLTRGSGGTSQFLGTTTVANNTIVQDVNALTANFGLIDMRLDDDPGAHGAVNVTGNSVTLGGGFGVATAAHAIKLRGNLTNVTVSGNVLDGGGVGNAGGMPPTSGVFLQTTDATYGPVPASASVSIDHNVIVGFDNAVSIADAAGAPGGLPVGNNVHVNRNDIAANPVGISNGPATVDGTCNWWGSALGPAPAQVSSDVTFQPWLTSSDLDGACNGGVARSLKLAALDELYALESSDSKIEKAIEEIEESLTPAWWIDDDTLDAKDGKKVFDREKKAVHELMKLDPTPTTDAVIAALVEADRQLAQVAIDEATAHCATLVTSKAIEKCNAEVAKALEEMAKAQDDLATGDYDKAIENYRKAWEKAQKALEVSG